MININIRLIYQYVRTFRGTFRSWFAIFLCQTVSILYSWIGCSQNHRIPMYFIRYFFTTDSLIVLQAIVWDWLLVFRISYICVFKIFFLSIWNFFFYFDKKIVKIIQWRSAFFFCYAIEQMLSDTYPCVSLDIVRNRSYKNYYQQSDCATDDFFISTRT